jgi:hypothetical protein
MHNETLVSSSGEGGQVRGGSPGIRNYDSPGLAIPEEDTSGVGRLVKDGGEGGLERLGTDSFRRAAKKGSREGDSRFKVEPQRQTTVGVKRLDGRVFDDSLIQSMKRMNMTAALIGGSRDLVHTYGGTEFTVNKFEDRLM